MCVVKNNNLIYFYNLLLIFRHEQSIADPFWAIFNTLRLCYRVCGWRRVTLTLLSASPGGWLGLFWKITELYRIKVQSIINCLVTSWLVLWFCYIYFNIFFPVSCLSTLYLVLWRLCNYVHWKLSNRKVQTVLVRRSIWTGSGLDCVQSPNSRSFLYTCWKFRGQKSFLSEQARRTHTHNKESERERERDLKFAKSWHCQPFMGSAT